MGSSGIASCKEPPAVKACPLPFLNGRLARAILLLAFAGLITALVGLTPIDRPKLSDPRGTLLVSQSILSDGDVKLTEYADALGPDLKGKDFFHQLYWSEKGEILFAYPIGNSLISLPAVWVANLMGYDMLQPVDEIAVQRVLAPLSVGMAFLLIFALSRIWLPYWLSVAWAVAMTAGTAISSTLGSALFSHNGLALWLLAALILTFHPRCRVSRWCAVATGFCLFMGFISRGQGAFFIIALYVYLLLADWKRIPWVVTGSLPPLLLFSAWSWQVYGTLFPGSHYYHGWGFDLTTNTLNILYGHTLSASRGLFVFSSFLLLVLLAPILYRDGCAKEKALIIPAVSIPLHFAVISCWEFWWGGWCFGPRLSVDTMPAWALAGIIAIHHWNHDSRKLRKVVLMWCFVALVVASSWIHIVKGLHTPATYAWNYSPDPWRHPQIFFDWRFPQFLASDKSVGIQQLEYEGLEVTPLERGERALPGRTGMILSSVWHEVEGSGVDKFVWSSKGPAKIYLLPELLSSLDLTAPHELEIWLGSYGAQAYAIFLNGKPVGEISNRTGETQHLRFPIPAGKNLGENGLEIAITAQDAKRPSEVEGSPDTRQLGVRLHGLSISESKQ